MVPQSAEKITPTAFEPAWSGERSDDEKKHDSQDGDTGELRFQPVRARPGGLGSSASLFPRSEHAAGIVSGCNSRGGRFAFFRKIEDDIGRENCFLRNFLRNNSVRVKIDEKNPRY